MATSGLTTKQVNDIISQELSQIEWEVLFAGIKGVATGGPPSFAGGQDKVAVSGRQEVNVVKLAERVTKASDFQTHR